MTDQPPVIGPWTLAPDRDRPDSPEFDWTPEVLNLTDAAALVVRAHQTSPGYRYLMIMWEALTGLGEAEALTFAYQIATNHPPVTAVVPPF